MYRSRPSRSTDFVSPETAKGPGIVRGLLLDALVSNEEDAGIIRRYCFDAVQPPTHPSERRYEPEPLRLEKRPELVQVMPPEAPAAETEPFGLT